MPGLSLLSRCASGAMAMALAIAPVVLVSGVNAASVNGLASATVIGAIASQPVLISLQSSQTSQAGALAFPIRLGFTIDQPVRVIGALSGGGAGLVSGAGPSFGITLIDVDSAGVARFSVAGMDATSGYIVQFPTSVDSLLNRSPSAANDCASGTAPRTAPGCASDASLIVPAQALTGGGRLAVEVSQALNKLIAGELSVQVNYN
jgi:hypothetical protein